MRARTISTSTRASLWAPAVLLLCLGGPACAGPGKAEGAGAKDKGAPAAGKEGKVADKAGQGAARPIRIEETTISDLHGWRVTVGNIMRDKWKGPDGKEREGITAEIGLYDEGKKERGRTTLGEGAPILINGHRYTLVRVQAGKGSENGFVELRGE